jgi:Tfp pilus assembly protein PilX
MKNDQGEHKDHGLMAFGLILVLAVVVLLAAITLSGMDKFG